MRDKVSSDRRVRRTKSQLRSCLGKLLQEKTIQDISVKELADMADINRGTFYLHYKDVFDLLNHVEDELIDDFHSILNKYNDMPNPNGGIAPINESLLTDIFSYIYDNADMVSTLVGPNGDNRFINSFHNVLRGKIFDDWAKDIRRKDIAEFEVFYSFAVSGCIGITQQWFKEGMTTSPKELAAMTNKFILNGFNSIT